MECCNLSYSGKPDPYFSVSQLNFMSIVSICRRKRNKFNERDTLKIFISYGDSLLLSGKSLHSFCEFFFLLIANGYRRDVKRYGGTENANVFSNCWSLYHFCSCFLKAFSTKVN